MTRSSRLPADLTPNATTRALQEIRRSGVAIIDLTESNPTRVGLDYPRDLLAPLAAPAGLVYEPHPLGMPSARAAVAADFARRGLTVSADCIALTASTSEAYALLFKLQCDAGDAVVVPRPSYPLFEHLTVLESIVARPYRLEYHDGWRVDVDDLRQSIDDRTRAVLVVAPNNPTGSFLHADDYRAIAELCAGRDLMLIGDEVFADFPLDAQPNAAPVLSRKDALVCSLGGLSKSIGLPQLKLGWIAFGGDANRVDGVMRAYELVADAYLSVSTPVQIALESLLREGAAIRHQIQGRIARNLAALRDLATQFPALSVLKVEGGWSAVVQIPAYQSEETLVLELLSEDHVLVHPGYFYDFENEAFVVVSLLVAPAVFDSGVERLFVRATRSASAPMALRRDKP